MSERLNFVERVANMLRAYETGAPLPQDRVTVREVLKTSDARILVPQAISTIMLEAAEPEYIATRFFQEIRLTEGDTIYLPQFGALVAHDIPEGAPYPEEQIDIALNRAALHIRATKVGLRVPITQEMVDNSRWDVIGINLRAAARAMARKKEEKLWNEIATHGHVVFDNSLRDRYPEAGTTGLDENGDFNDTFSVGDMIDLMMAVYANGFTPTDLIVHPLAWATFAKNALIGVLSQGALGGYGVNYNLTNYPAPSIQLRPGEMAGRLPFPITVSFSPYMPFDLKTKRFSFFVLDRNNVGVLVVRERMTTDEFFDPERDIINLKVKEIYGAGVLYEGRACAVARNISAELSYPLPQAVRVVQTP